MLISSQCHLGKEQREVKPPPFEYHRATSLEDALEVLSEFGENASVLAGGQSLIPLLNLRLARPSVIVDINHIPDLDQLTVTSEGVVLGAMVRARTVERHPQVLASLPVLTDAIRYIAHPQIRVRTTIGGNIAHADPSSELPAVLVAVGGSVELARKGGQRTVAATDFFQDFFTTSKRPEELVVSVRFPTPASFRWRFLEAARRRGDYGMVSVCVGLRIEDGQIADARIAIAGCGPVPVRPATVEQAVIGAPVDGALATSFGAAVRDVVEPMSDIHATASYRRSLAGVLAERAVTSIVEES